MHDAKAMTMFHARNDLLEYTSRFVFVQTHLAHQVFKQITTRYEFHCYVSARVGSNNIKQSYYIWMIESHLKSDFLLHCNFFHFSVRDHFDCDVLTRYGIFSGFDLAELSPPNRLPELIIADNITIFAF